MQSTVDERDLLDKTLLHKGIESGLRDTSGKDVARELANTLASQSACNQVGNTLLKNIFDLVEGLPDKAHSSDSLTQTAV